MGPGPRWASWTAGASSAAAVPEVTATAAGRPAAFARPSAKKPAPRSSTCDQARRPGSRASASASGAEREPGDVHASVMPQRTSSSQKAPRRTWLSVAAGIMWRVRRTIVLLHGFTHTGRSWDPVVARLGERYNAVTPDLPGHGPSAHARPAGLKDVVTGVVADAPERFVLAGYSMGGRVALNVALARPDRVEALVLIGTTPGIADSVEREARRAEDEALAAQIEESTMEAFASRWGRNPLLKGQPPEVAQAAHEDRLRNRPAGLAAALRGLGQGACEPVWGRLGELRMPVTLVVGERDARYRKLGERMTAAMPEARMIVVPATGHAVHLEAPEIVAQAIAQAASDPARPC